jgi:hypothetical protein
MSPAAMTEVIMSFRSALTAIASLGVLMLAASPALPCERHQQHTAKVSEAVTPAPPAPAAEPQASTAVVISPAAAAAMSVTEALGAESYDMRCARKRSLQQALTQ